MKYSGSAPSIHTLAICLFWNAQKSILDIEKNFSIIELLAQSAKAPLHRTAQVPRRELLLQTIPGAMVICVIFQVPFRFLSTNMGQKMAKVCEACLRMMRVLPPSRVEGLRSEGSVFWALASRKPLAAATSASFMGTAAWPAGLSSTSTAGVAGWAGAVWAVWAGGAGGARSDSSGHAWEMHDK